MRTLSAIAVLSLAAGAAEPVVLTETDARWTLRNGLVEFTVDRKESTIPHLALAGGPNLVTLGYYDTNGSPGGHGGAGYLRFGRHEPAVSYVVYRGEDRVDVCLRTDVDNLDPEFHQPLRTELHYVLHRGDPGFYVYWLRWHEEGMRPFDMAQTRHVIKAPREHFDQWQVTERLHGTYPTAEQRAAARKVYDATFQLPDGRYLTKYANAVASENHHVSGLYSSDLGLGLWQIHPSNEYVNGGPTKRNLTIHEGDPILLHMVQSGHFLGRGIRIEGTWCKLYGPVFFYLNRADSREEAWEDANRRLRAEQNRWPYAWVQPRQVPDAYPVQRGAVAGTVRRANGASPEGAFVILGAPEPEWQYQGKGYMYWTRARRDGTFEIDEVRPGTYTVFVWQRGVFGEARREGIAVRPDGRTEVGPVVLEPETHGRRLWQIGTPDRTAAEYRHGTEFRQVYLHRRYEEDFPNDVRFVVGESDEAVDWNYYQPGGTTWEVVFERHAPVPDHARLTLALAGSGYRPAAKVQVALNDTPVGEAGFEDGDSALWRLGNYDAYQLRTLELPAAAWKHGTNILRLTIPGDRMWVMYDFVRLEAPE